MTMTPCRPGRAFVLLGLALAVVGVIGYAVQLSMHMLAAPWLLVVPALALSATVLAFNFLGDSLRDALDPRSSWAVKEQTR